MDIQINNIDLNNIELNAVLYYADFLSLQNKSIPVTDTCKYFFIYNTPINAAFIADNKPIYDENNEYFRQSATEYCMLRDKFGTDGVMSFINNISCIGTAGAVDGERMLRCIHQYSQKNERYEALTKYKKHVKQTKYSHIIKGEDGKSKRVYCTKYVAHDEQAKGMCTEPKIHYGIVEDTEIDA